MDVIACGKCGIQKEFRMVEWATIDLVHVGKSECMTCYNERHLCKNCKKQVVKWGICKTCYLEKMKIDNCIL